jgi:transposase
LDLSRRRVDVCAISELGELLGRFRSPIDRDGLRGLARRMEPYGSVRAVIESMNGARYVHDEMTNHGWRVLVADAQKVKGLAPLACKTDKVDARVLAELSWRDLVPAIWLPTPEIRGERETARYRLHLVKHRSTLKNRIHGTLIAHGHQVSVSDVFGAEGRRLLAGLELPEPWAGTTAATLELIDDLDRRIGGIEKELRRVGADHRYVPLLMTAPGIGWVLAYTIASEIGEIERFPTARRFVSYTGLCPRVHQSGELDLRGRLSKHGPRYLRWALIDAAAVACRHPLYAERYQQLKRRVGRQRGSKVAQIDLARRLAEAIWHMLTHNQPFQPFTPAGASSPLAATTALH